MTNQTVATLQHAIHHGEKMYNRARPEQREHFRTFYKDFVSLNSDEMDYLDLAEPDDWQIGACMNYAMDCVERLKSALQQDTAEAMHKKLSQLSFKEQGEVLYEATNPNESLLPLLDNKLIASIIEIGSSWVAFSLNAWEPFNAEVAEHINRT